jgi:hypothetical protein
MQEVTGRETRREQDNKKQKHMGGEFNQANLQANAGYSFSSCLAL